MTELLRLFDDAFGIAPLPLDCAISLGRESGQDDLADVIAIVTKRGGRADLIRRLTAEHPVERAHVRQHDARMWDAMTEALAFAWAADVADLPGVSFCLEEGRPDLKVGDRLWVEAKTIHLSATESSAIDEALATTGIYFGAATMKDTASDGFRAKWDALLGDCRRKLGRLPADHQLLAFIRAEFDLDTRRIGPQMLKQWANEAFRSTGMGIVGVTSWAQWSQPFVTVGGDILNERTGRG